eukprot:2051752-Pyramimonas_sp.AAC.1
MAPPGAVQSYPWVVLERGSGVTLHACCSEPVGLIARLLEDSWCLGWILAVTSWAFYLDLEAVGQTGLGAVV